MGPQGGEQGNVIPIKLAELTVAMSPSHAKAMSAGFYTAIANYEKQLGPIALDAKTQKAFDDTFAPLIKK